MKMFCVSSIWYRFSYTESGSVGSTPRNASPVQTKATRLPAGMLMPQIAITNSRSLSVYHLLAISVIATEIITYPTEMTVYPASNGINVLLTSERYLIQAPATKIKDATRRTHAVGKCL